MRLDVTVFIKRSVDTVIVAAAAETLQQSGQHGGETGSFRGLVVVNIAERNNLCLLVKRFSATTPYVQQGGNCHCQQTTKSHHPVFQHAHQAGAAGGLRSRIGSVLRLFGSSRLRTEFGLQLRDTLILNGDDVLYKVYLFLQRRKAVGQFEIFETSAIEIFFTEHQLVFECGYGGVQIPTTCLGLVTAGLVAAE